MSVNYTAYVFIGAEMDSVCFYETGEERYSCRNHGIQVKPYCGDCGSKCQVEAEALWTDGMKNAAKLYKVEPEVLWEQMEGEDGMCFNQGKNHIGIWRFGYDYDQIMFGMAVAMRRDDDSWGTVKDTLSPDDFGGYLTQVTGAFKAHLIDKPVKIWAIQDAG